PLFSPDGRRLADASLGEKFVRVWSADDAEPAEILAQPGYLSAAAFSPDGRRLASCGYDGEVRVCELGAGRAAFTRQVPGPDGARLATAGLDRTARLWDLATGQEVLALSGRDEGRAFAVAFSPDGERLAVAFEGSIEVWDASGPTAVRMSPDWHQQQVGL